MQIKHVRSKNLRLWIETGRSKSISPQIIARLRLMVQFLDAVQTVDQLRQPPNFGFHALKGDRQGTFAMTLTRNWRLTFRLEGTDSIVELDMEDYH